jgi:hypothetical protein
LFSLYLYLDLYIISLQSILISLAQPLA